MEVALLLRSSSVTSESNRVSALSMRSFLSLRRPEALPAFFGDVQRLLLPLCGEVVIDGAPLDPSAIDSVLTGSAVEAGSVAVNGGSSGPQSSGIGTVLAGLALGGDPVRVVAIGEDESVERDR